MRAQRQSKRDESKKNLTKDKDTTEQAISRGLRRQDKQKNNALKKGVKTKQKLRVENVCKNCVFKKNISYEMEIEEIFEVSNDLFFLMKN